MAGQEKGSESEKWQSKRQLTARLRFALKNGKYTDCVFNVTQEDEKEVFKAHKFMLINASCVFEAMFYGPLASDKPIVIKDISPRAFSALLDYVYTGALSGNLTVELIAEVWYAADKYQMEHLASDCETFLIDKTNGSNVGVVLNQARLLKNENVEEICWDIIECDTDFDKTDLFEALSKELLLELLDKDELNITNELQLFKGIERRCRYECEAQNLDVTPEKMQAFGRDLVRKIRFFSIELQDLVLEAVNSELLTKEEKLAIFANVANANKLLDVLPMPTGFSLIEKKRSILHYHQTNKLDGKVITRSSITCRTVPALVADQGLVECPNCKVFNLTMTCYAFELCIDKITFHDCKAIKNLVISDNNNEVLFTGKTPGNVLVFNEQLILSSETPYNFEITLSKTATCKAYKRPLNVTWKVFDRNDRYHYHSGSGQRCILHLESSSDFILIQSLTVSVADRY